MRISDWSSDVCSSDLAPANFRMLHTMLRVLDLDKSIDFYVDKMGMKLLRRQDYPTGEFTLAFVGCGDEKDHAVIELTHNWGQKESYSIGSGYGHKIGRAQCRAQVCQHV